MILLTSKLQNLQIEKGVKAPLTVSGMLRARIGREALTKVNANTMKFVGHK